MCKISSQVRHSRRRASRSRSVRNDRSGRGFERDDKQVFSDPLENETDLQRLAGFGFEQSLRHDSEKTFGFQEIAPRF